MYARNHLNWSAAGYYSDPIPGDPTVLETKARDCRNSAGSIGLAAEHLRKLRARDQTISDAIAKIMAKADETATTLDAAKVRYSAIANALFPYATSLRTEQTNSEKAINDAVTAQGSIRQARTARSEAKTRLTNADDTTRAQAQTDVLNADTSVRTAESALADAKARIQTAISNRDTAARTAASSIDMELKDSSLNDSFWDKVKNFITKAAQWVWEHLDEIALVLDLIALVLAVTGVGGPIAAALLLVSKALHALAKIKIAVDVGLALYEGYKTGDWSSAALTIGGIAVGYVAGKAINKGATKFLTGNSGAAKWMNKMSMKAGRNSYDNAKALWSTARGSYDRNASFGTKLLFGNTNVMFPKSARYPFTTSLRTYAGELLPGIIGDAGGVAGQRLFNWGTSRYSSPMDRVLGAAK